ncbi:uncharacterized protein PADG_03645 [Paracoccidioides brasiliensis Pb18]|uniref:Uncharacterized protein n=1 Tax=Paracoccidioides brasiliensis (strain Pb18) TaxID=502780 RepID=C1G8Q9_PARBD|nr:uncharacterized protein PADG_03645 [Paracoccidioides brasiliensis Pb18]EEH47561.2 hypothetical protein PADG_03645 [Paracoccidioides brasiliensis Pb18]
MLDIVKVGNIIAAGETHNAQPESSSGKIFLPAEPDLPFADIRIGDSISRKFTPYLKQSPAKIRDLQEEVQRLKKWNTELEIKHRADQQGDTQA